MDYTARFCNKKTIDLSHRGGVFMLKHMGNRTFMSTYLSHKYFDNHSVIFYIFL